MEKNLGGDRLGSGNKNNVHMHNYERSTHNLSEGFKTAMACGTLVPFYCNIGLPGDTFDIDLNAMVRTIPTIGPLFGSFKLQLDLFQCPIRLYQAIMHNNPLNVGMAINQVKLPMIRTITGFDRNATLAEKADAATFANNSLMKYLGVSGMGTYTGNGEYFSRDFNAVPVLSYYDVGKTYYSNKQEEMCYCITGNTDGDEVALQSVESARVNNGIYYDWEYAKSNDTWTYKWWLFKNNVLRFKGTNLSTNDILDKTPSTSLQTYIDNGDMTIIKNTDTTIIVKLNRREKYINESGFRWSVKQGSRAWQNQVEIAAFPLANIDKMRYDILKFMEMGNPFVIEEGGEGDYEPYNLLTKQARNNQTTNKYSQNGLMLKTYQSDIFNNWIRTDWIDGENGIAEITKIKTDDNGFYLDTLNVMEKIYNQLNRTAAAGGTLEDWQEVTWGEEAIKRAESPIYMGGMSSEVVFEEVISTADTSEENKLGTLAGKGTLMGRKGGNIVIKPREAVVILGIVSITPRLDYTQGNAWYMTELESIDDLHKPALDGIGFQELITEQMHHADTNVTDNEVIKHSAGKIPAWLNYQTAYDKAYSFFADQQNQGFMVLGRNYEMDFRDTEKVARIKDLTTYIDPSKFNYAFADQELDSQNFWVQISTKVTARRKMSAHMIPNL